MSDLFSLEPCGACGKIVASSETREHEGNRLCKNCHAATRRSIKPRAAPPREERVKKETPVIDFMPYVSALSSSFSAIVEHGLTIHLAPVQVELVQGTIAGPAPVVSLGVGGTLPGMQPAISSIETVVLRVMSSGTRQKWRAGEVLDQVRVHFPDLASGLDRDGMRRVLDRLATGSAGPVVQLSTRYMKRDMFDPLEELDIVDLLVLKVLDGFHPACLPATVVHEVIQLANVETVSLSTVLNHMRVLKTPAWGLVSKTGPGLRDPYTITDQGRALLARAGAALDAPAKNTPWWNRLRAWGLIDDAGDPTTRAILLTGTLQDVIVGCSSVQDKQFIVACMQGDPVTGTGAERKRAVLARLGFSHGNGAR